MKKTPLLQRRRSGILMPIFSLPSPYGIGTLGKEAYDFVDFLKKAGQSYWQILPLGPTTFHLNQRDKYLQIMVLSFVIAFS